MLTLMVDFVTYHKNNCIFSNHALFFGRCKFHVLFKSCIIFWYLLIFREISLKTSIFSNHALFFGRCKFHVLFISCVIFWYLLIFGKFSEKTHIFSNNAFFLVVVNFMLCSNHALCFGIYFFWEITLKNAMYLRPYAPDFYKGFHGTNFYVQSVLFNVKLLIIYVYFHGKVCTSYRKA